MLKLLEGFAGWGTAVLLYAQAKVLMVFPLTLSCPPVHLLQPVQRTSTAQWVEFREEVRAL